MGDMGKKVSSVGWIRFPKADGKPWIDSETGVLSIFAVWPALFQENSINETPLTLYTGTCMQHPYVDAVRQRNWMDTRRTIANVKRYGDPTMLRSISYTEESDTKSGYITHAIKNAREYNFPPDIAAGLVYARDYYVRGSDEYMLIRGAICIASTRSCLYDPVTDRYFLANRDLLTTTGKSLLTKLDNLYKQKADLITVLDG